MKAAFDPKLGVIVIPPELDYDAIEGELFKIQSEKEYGQFWGQRGIGYKGKKWIPVGGVTEDNEEFAGLELDVFTTEEQPEDYIPSLIMRRF